MEDTQAKPKTKKQKRAPSAFVSALKDMGYWQGGQLKPFPKKGTKEYEEARSRADKSKAPK